MCNVVTDRIDKVLILKLVKDLNFCVDIVYLQPLISKSKVGTFRFEDLCLIP